MVRLKVTAGSRKGVVRTFEPGEGGEPSTVLMLFLGSNRDVEWELDFSEATPEEQLEWKDADVLVRIFRAAADGRPIYFIGEEFDPKTEIRGLAEAAQEYFEEFDLVVESDSPKALSLSVIKKPDRPAH